MQQANRQGFRRIDLLLLLVVIIWAVNYPVLKIGLKEFPPLVFAGIRFPAAAILLMLAARRPSIIVSGNRKDIFLLILCGLLGITAYQLLLTYGLSVTSATNAAILVAASSIFVAILEWAMRRDKLGLGVFSGVVIGFIGVYLVVVGSSRSINAGHILGDILILLAALVWAIYTVLIQPVLTKYNPLAVTSALTWAGALAFLVLSFKDMIHFHWSEISIQAWLSLGYNVLFSSTLGLIIWSYGIELLGGTRTTVYMYLLPLITSVAAFVMIGERMTWNLGVGAIFILGGVYLARL